MNASFVREGAEASDRVIEGNVDLDGRSNKIFHGLEFIEVVYSYTVSKVTFLARNQD